MPPLLCARRLAVAASVSLSLGIPPPPPITAATHRLSRRCPISPDPPPPRCACTGSGFLRASRCRSSSPKPPQSQPSRRTPNDCKGLEIIESVTYRGCGAVLVSMRCLKSIRRNPENYAYEISFPIDLVIKTLGLYLL
ncbi:uncharacterized protein LOC125192828 isoform X2 [Salvia hispanica]|uniref:uncharacterized protein LOC125192828 isoform X2 n=1 Tax=Salvia hispanica TaxID=49212 RepID=UPI0020096E7C|nr:uncharacterized protein LOC125192828 isoform X2 [Salvia hispanica]